jgi:O-6-methylguanine DNA methyltransferase
MIVERAHSFPLSHKEAGPAVHLKTQKKTFTAIISHQMADVTVRARKGASGIIVESISLGLRKRRDRRGELMAPEGEMEEYANQIREFLDSKTKSFDKVPLDLSWCSEFQKKVLLTARKIPRGNVVSYSELARNSGYPRAVRAVASVMRNNRFPLVIPCHRVVGKNGDIGGFMGAKSGEPVLLKRRLLALEGVSDLRISLKKAH